MALTHALRAKVVRVGIGVLVALGMSSCGGGSTSSSHLPVNNAVPSLISFSPFNATAGGAGFSLTLTGSGFASNATVMWNGNALATSFVSSNQLTAQVSASDIAAAGIAHITISNPAPGGGVSSVFRFGVNSTSPPANFLYVGSNPGVLAPNTIYGFTIDPNSGSLTALAGSPFTASPYDTISGPMGMDRLGKFLYAINVPATYLIGNPSCTSCTNFAGFSSNSTGDLVPLAGSPLLTQVPFSFIGDPTGNLFYDSGGPGTTQGSDIVTMRIDANSGNLIPIADSPGITGFTEFSAMVLNPSGTFIYGAGAGIWGGSINLQTGNIAFVAAPLANSDPLALAIHPSGKFLFVVGFSASPNAFPAVFSYAIDPTTGALTLVDSIQYDSNNLELTHVVVHPSGQFLYVTEAGPYVLGFSIDSNGNITPVPGSPFPVDGATGTVSMATDPVGKFLYVSTGFDSIVGFTVDATSGALTPMAGSPFLAAVFPGVIVISP